MEERKAGVGIVGDIADASLNMDGIYFPSLCCSFCMDLYKLMV